MAETTQWEYRAVSLGTFWTEPKDEEIETILNQLGEQGWEVVSVFTRYGTNRVRVVAKRLLSEDEARRRRRGWPP
jgi:hypothetical protein